MDNKKWEFVHKVNRHSCSLPRHKDSGVDIGDIIRCKECNTHWECYRLESGVQWDPIDPPVLVFKKVR